MSNSDIAVLIPCLNEELTIGKVVADFRRVLPEATIYVYDNGSSDRSVEIAQAAGAVVETVAQRGKGNVLRAMFLRIEAGYYILVDGDDTYPAEAAPSLLDEVRSGRAEMAVGNRLMDGSYSRENQRLGHNFGNRLVVGLIRQLFKSDLGDILSGYRCFSRRFVKSTPILSHGFSVETEITLHALDKRLAVVERPIAYRDRPAGSVSKLNTVRDGLRVLRLVFWLFKDYRPLFCFAATGLVFALTGMAVGVPVLIEFARTAYITHVPLAILASALGVLSFLSFVCGFILDTVVRQHQAMFEVLLLRIPPRP